MSHATTAADFRTFATVARLWIARLGLTDWDVYFEHVPYEGRYASCSLQPRWRKATLLLSTMWGPTRPTDERLAASALHEVLHIACADLVHCGLDRFGNEHEFERAEEALVMRLMRVLIPEREEVLPVRVPRRRPLKANGAGEAVESAG